MDRGSPSPAPSESFSVHESVWTREQDSKGRVYFFNRATGCSQWHIPNDLYKARVFDPEPIFEDVQKMPGSARAMINVNSVTEVARGARSPSAEALRSNVFSRLTNGKSDDFQAEGTEPIVAPQPLLKVTLVKATGLKDTDFMPGLDHSDPYCTCEVMGRPGSLVKTHVVQDSLNPTWNHSSYMPEYIVGDVLMLRVWDSDGEQQDVNAARIKRQGTASMFDIGDDMLGRIMLTEDDLREPRCRDYRLEESRDAHAFLTVETRMMTAWPMLKGSSKVDAAYEIERAAPGYRVQVVEQADKGSKVVSFDVHHREGGYRGNYIGAYMEAVAKLNTGDTIILGGQRHTVDKITQPKEGEAVQGRAAICYVYVREKLQEKVVDGTAWRKVTPSVDSGFHGDRIVIWFEPVTSQVSQIPYIG